MLINRIFKIFLLIIFFASSSFAQKGYKNPEEYAKAADKLFEKGEFQKAFVYYQTLRSNDMGDPDYNFRLGVCMMYSEPERKERPIYYFEIALKFNIEDNRVYYYLGRAYHNNYRFAEAKTSYEQYKTLASGRLVKSFDIDRRIQECSNGIALLSSINLLYVIDKQLVKSKTFYKSYNIPGSGAKIVAIPLELRTKYDDKHKAPPFGLFFPKGKMFYYASYGSRGVNGLDIYRSHRENDGTWSKTENLGTQINTPYDDAYPYITLDGKTLYFSSKGHSSMGGYDVFKSTFNLNSVSWNDAENLNFPINTPFDDIFYVPDSNVTLAHFSSDRQSLSGRVYVYYVGISKQEQNQDLAKVFRDGGDATNITKLLKDIAELKTNINVEEYKRKEKKIKANADNIIAVNDSNKVKRYITKRSDLRDDENFDDIVKEGYNTYKRLQYKTTKLRRQRTTIGKIAAQNDKLVEEYTAKGDEKSLAMAKEYEEAAKISRDIGKELGEQIKKTEKITELVLIQAGELQKQAGLQQKDSVEEVFKNIQELNSVVEDFKEPTKEIVDQKYALVRAAKEKATLKMIENRTAKKELEQLNADIAEYEEAMKASEDADEKQEYADMLVAMKAEVKQKTDEQAKLQSSYDELQANVDKESEKLTALNASLEQYYQVSKALEGEAMSEELSKSIEKDIEEVKQKSEEYIVANAPKEEIVNDTNEIVAENAIDKQIDEIDKNIEGNKKGVIAEPKNDIIAASKATQEAQNKAKAEAAIIAANKIKSDNQSQNNNELSNSNSDVIDNDNITVAENDNLNPIDSASVDDNEMLAENNNLDSISYVKVSGNSEIENSDDNNDTSTIALNENSNNSDKQELTEAQAAAALINKSHGKIPEKQKTTNEVSNDNTGELAVNNVDSKIENNNQEQNNTEEIGNVNSNIQENKVQKESNSNTPIEFASVGNTEAKNQSGNVNNNSNITNTSSKASDGINVGNNGAKVAGAVAVTEGSLNNGNSNKSGQKQNGETISIDSSLASVDMQTFTSDIRDIKEVVTAKSKEIALMVDENNATIAKLQVYAIEEFKKSEKAKEDIKQLEENSNIDNIEGVTLETLQAQANESELLAKVAYKKAEDLKLQNKNYEQSIDRLAVIENNTNQILNEAKTNANSADLITQKANVNTELYNVQADIVDNSVVSNNDELINQSKESIVVIKQKMIDSERVNDSLIAVKQKISSKGNNAQELASIEKSIISNQQKYNVLKQNEQQFNNTVNEAKSAELILNSIAAADKTNSELAISADDKVVISKLAAVVEAEKQVDMTIAKNNSNGTIISNTNNNNTIAKSELISERKSQININDSDIEIPTYQGDSAKVELVKEYLEPSYDELKNIESRRNNNNLLMAKSIGLEIRYSQMSLNISKDITNLNAKIQNTSDESLKNTYKAELQDKKAQYIAIKRKETAAAIYTGVLKEEQVELDNEYLSVKEEFVSNKKLIENGSDNIALSSEATKNSIEKQDAVDKEDVYLAKLSKENENNENEIAKIENSIDDENAKYAKLMQKLDSKTASYEEETKESKRKALEIEISKLETETQQSRYIVNNYKKQKSDIEAGIQKNNNIIEAVNTHIISLESAKAIDIAEITDEQINNSFENEDNIETGIFELESRIDSKQIGLGSIDEEGKQELPYYNDNSIDFVYFDKTDIAQHKKLLLLAQIELINKQIDLLAQQSLNTVNINEKAKINEEMNSLKEDRDETQTAIYNLDAFIVSAGGSTNNRGKYSSKELISKINLQKDKFTMASILLRDTARYFNSDEKQKILDLAADLEHKTSQLDMAIIEINQIDNINMYRERLIVLSEIHYNMANQQLANLVKSELDKADANDKLAQQSRKSAENKKLSIDEQEQLKLQAVEYETAAINILQNTIKEYGNEDQIAMVSEKAKADVTNNYVEKTKGITEDAETLDSVVVLAEEKRPAEIVGIANNDSLIIENEIAQNDNEVADNQQVINNGGNIVAVANNTGNTIDNEVTTANVDKTNEVNDVATVSEENTNKANNVDDNSTQKANSTIAKTNTGETKATGVNVTKKEDVSNENTKNQFDNSNSVDLVYSNINFQEITLDELAQIDENRLPADKVEEYKIRKADMLGIYIGSSSRNQAKMSFYSTEARIFMNPPLPDGLVFKVQIAAFRKPIPASTFGDIKPVNGETAPNSAFTRYMAGLFTNYTDANQSKNRIRVKGYKDAFVVAYFNGRRISVRQARAMIANGTAYTDAKLLAVANKLKVDNYGQSKAADATSSAYIGVAIDKALETNSGLVYTVQIGVFRGVRSSQRLANAPDIFYNITTRGYHRYFSGKYNSRTTAVNARNQIRANGIKDAFVIVFNNGKRISIAQAQQLKQQTTNNKQQTTNNKQQTTNNKQQTTNNKQQTTNNIVFKVQLGAFRTNRVGAQLRELERLSDNGLDTYNVGNLIKYTTQGYTSYRDAVNARNKIRTIGPKDVFVIAFKNGVRISVKDARAELGQ